MNWITKFLPLSFKEKYVLKTGLLLKFIVRPFRNERYSLALKIYKLYRIIQNDYFKKRIITLRTPVSEIDYLKANASNYKELVDGIEINLVGPDFSKRKKKNKKIITGDLYYGILNNSAIISNSNFYVVEPSTVICNGFYLNNIKRLETNSGSNFTPFIDKKKAIVDLPTTSTNLAKGISLCGPCTNNYYHWLVEVIPKLFLIQQLPEIYSDFPLILDYRVSQVPQLMEVLRLYNKEQRSVVFIKSGVTAYINELVIISQLSNILNDLKQGNKRLLEDVVIHPQVIRFLRQPFSNSKTLKRDRKIYLTRKNQTRRKFNENEVLQLMHNFEFEIITMEELSFIEQVELFQQSSFIIGATGAALTNLVFCASNTKAICMISTNWNLGIFSNLAYQIDVNLKYLVANYYEDEGANILPHSSFVIDVNELKELIKKIS